MTIDAIQEYKRYRTIKMLKMLKTVRTAREITLMAIAIGPLPVDKRLRRLVINPEAVH